jgi:hypothetical protein
LLRPPAPGLTARKGSDGTITVKYWFEAFDRVCEPAYLSLTADVSTDALPGSGHDVRIGKPRGTVEVSLQRRVSNADVITASVRTEDGLPGASSRVSILE